MQGFVFPRLHHSYSCKCSAETERSESYESCTWTIPPTVPLSVSKRPRQRTDCEVSPNQTKIMLCVAMWKILVNTTLLSQHSSTSNCSTQRLTEILLSMSQQIIFTSSLCWCPEECRNNRRQRTSQQPMYKKICLWLQT